MLACPRDLPSQSAVWIGVPEPLLVRRVRDDPSFGDDSSSREEAAERFAARSVAFDRWIRDETAARGLPYPSLSGDESPDDLVALCSPLHGLDDAP